MNGKKCATVSLQASAVALNCEDHGSSATSHHQDILVITTEADSVLYIIKRDINAEYYEVVSGTNPPGAARPVISRHIFERLSGRRVKYVEHDHSPSVDVEVV